MIQHVILCEGYDDRAFWAGWLLHMGLRDLSLRPGTRSRQQVKDPWGLPLKPGTYGYATKTDAFVRLVSCDGGENVPRAAEQFLKGRATHPVGHLLINLDADDTLVAPSTRADESVRGVARKAHGSDLPDATGAYAVDDARVRPVIWRCPDSDAPGLPAQQTLERLVSAAIVAAHPGRGPSVQHWLTAEPRGGDSHKQHAMSYYAKWYARDRGPDAFYSELWHDPRVAAELERRLRDTGAWQHVEALAHA